MSWSWEVYEAFLGSSWLKSCSTFHTASQSIDTAPLKSCKASVFSFVYAQPLPPPHERQNTFPFFKTLLPLFVRPHRGKLFELALASLDNFFPPLPQNFMYLEPAAIYASKHFFFFFFLTWRWLCHPFPALQGLRLLFNQPVCMIQGAWSPRVIGRMLFTGMLRARHHKLGPTHVMANIGYDMHRASG